MGNRSEVFPKKEEYPYTVYNCAMSLDGKISTISNDSSYSCDEDWMRVHQLRHAMDGICVGIRTVLSDDPKLRVKFIKDGKNPHRILLDSSLRIPVESQLLKFERAGVRVLIGTTSRAVEAETNKIEELESLDVEVIEAGDGTMVDLPIFWSKIKQCGISSVLLEGGGTLAFSMLESGLVDEVRVFIAPYIVGGLTPPAISMAMGAGFKLVDDSINLEVEEVKKLGNGIYSRFLVKK